MSGIKVLNILDVIEAIGEDSTNSVLSGFSCSKNLEIENFVRKNAVDFAKKKMSITYLVLDDYENIRAIFSLTHKAVEIKNENLSSTMRKRIERFSKLDEGTDSYTVSAFLIAQFGKNDAFNDEENISGNNLMDFTFEVLTSVQHDIGGSIVYLECEENKKLLEFYEGEQNLFRPFNERFSETDNVKYIQLLKFF